MHLDDAVNVGVGEVGQGDIVAVQKGQTGVVVLEVQRLAHAFRKLVDEAEDAFVAAGVLFVHEGRGKLHAGILVFFLVQRKGQQFRPSVDKQ